MQEQFTLSKPGYSSWLPLWARIGMACLFFLDAALMMSKHFLRLKWVPWLSFGVYWLIYLQRQPGEPWGAFLSKPRAVATTLLLLISIVWFWHDTWAFVFPAVAH